MIWKNTYYYSAPTFADDCNFHLLGGATKMPHCNEHIKRSWGGVGFIQLYLLHKREEPFVWATRLLPEVSSTHIR